MTVMVKCDTLYCDRVHHTLDMNGTVSIHPYVYLLVRAEYEGTMD